MTSKNTTLDDLNHDLTLLDSLSDKAILKLNDDANAHPEYPLAGPVRYLLNARANTIKPPETTSNETTENLSPLEKARAAAAARS